MPTNLTKIVNLKTKFSTCNNGLVPSREPLNYKKQKFPTARTGFPFCGQRRLGFVVPIYMRLPATNLSFNIRES